MKEYGELLLGLVLVVLGIAGIVYLLPDVWTVIKGIVGILALIIGAVILVLGVTDVRDKLGEKKREKEEAKEE